MRGWSGSFQIGQGCLKAGQTFSVAVIPWFECQMAVRDHIALFLADLSGVDVV
jgi:hypothetical protein